LAFDADAVVLVRMGGVLPWRNCVSYRYFWVGAAIVTALVHTDAGSMIMLAVVDWFVRSGHHRGAVFIKSTKAPTDSEAAKSDLGTFW
jgi:hypothetical protein